MNHQNTMNSWNESMIRRLWSNNDGSCDKDIQHAELNQHSFSWKTWKDGKTKYITDNQSKTSADQQLS